MYAYFIGRVTEYATDCIVLETNQIGRNIYVSAHTMQRLHMLEGEVKIYTYTYVKEDAFSLYGFMTKEELELFKKMISVSGIGPKGALAILSAMSFDDLIFAILSGDAKSISKAQGVGAKTAQRLILELKDKVSSELADLPDVNGVDIMMQSSESSAMQEAIEACVALGYSHQEAVRAMREIKETNLTSEEYVKKALKKLF